MTLVVLSTFASAEEARRVSRQLVHERLAACASLVPQVESVYRWKGEVEASTEALVIFKLPEKGWEPFVARLRELHSYEVPEIVALPVKKGFEPYLRWVGEQTGGG